METKDDRPLVFRLEEVVQDALFAVGNTIRSRINKAIRHLDLVSDKILEINKMQLELLEKFDESDFGKRFVDDNYTFWCDNDPVRTMARYYLKYDLRIGEDEIIEKARQDAEKFLRVWRLWEILDGLKEYYISVKKVANVLEDENNDVNFGKLKDYLKPDKRELLNELQNKSDNEQAALWRKWDKEGYLKNKLSSYGVKVNIARCAKEAGLLHFTENNFRKKL